MPPTLILIRHAQAEHNVNSDWSIHDPKLSKLGEQQCAELQEALKKEDIADKVEGIVVSAMRRTLQTAQLGLGWLIEEKKVPVLPHAGWQENADKPCDTGSPINVMAKEFPTFSFSQVDPSYPDKTSNLPSNPYAFTRQAILARGQDCLAELYYRTEKVIAVVSHSGFMRVAVANRRFANADYRVFEFDEEKINMRREERIRERREKGEGEGEYFLKEWSLTEERGGGLGRSEKGWAGPEDADFPPERVGEEETDEMPSVEGH